MSHAILGQFFKTEAAALERVGQLHKEFGDYRRYYVVCGKQGYLLVGGADLKEAGLIPRKKRGKDIRRVPLSKGSMK